MKKNKIRHLIVVLLSCCACNNQPKTKSNTQKVFESPPKFVLTEMNGRKLEEQAFFTMKYNNTFTLETGDGKVFTYVPKKHFGDDPFCNILANDDRGRQTAICIKNEAANKVLIMIENDEMISNFKGYRK